MITWEYLAGFTDGEGCIKSYHGYPRITYGQNTREVLDQIKVFLDIENAITLSRNCYYLQINSIAHIKHVLVNILPFLIVKRADALAALAMYERPLSERRTSPADERGV